MLILCCGDRNWRDGSYIREILSIYLSKIGPFQVVEGECRGADKLSRLAAESLGLGVIKMPAAWDRYGNAAGPIRNREMLDLDPGFVLAFHDDIVHSVGTKDCVEEAILRGFKTKVFTHLDPVRALLLPDWGSDVVPRSS